MKLLYCKIGSTIILLISLITSSLTAQELDTIPYIMDHHQNRLNLFATEPMKTGQIVFLGNSITEGGKWAEYFDNENILNRGIGGDIAHGVYNRLDEIIQRKPSKLFLMIGVNDLSKKIPEQIVAKKVEQIIAKLQSESQDTEIIVQSILPINETFDDFPDHYRQSAILLTNQLIHKVCMDNEVQYFNLYPYFLNAEHRLEPSLSNDGLHLNEKGYAKWVSLIKRHGLL